MGTLISVNCPVCRRPYVLRVNFEQLRETRPKALCARCGQRFDLLELAEKATEQSESATDRPSLPRSTTISGMPRKQPAISERTPPPTLAAGKGAQPGAYRATVDREAVRRARLRTRSRDEIRRALALPELQAVQQSQRTSVPHTEPEPDPNEAPPPPTDSKEVITDLEHPFPWIDSADPGLDALAQGGPDLTAILESLLSPSEEEASTHDAQKEEASEGT